MQDKRTIGQSGSRAIGRSARLLWVVPALAVLASGATTAAPGSIDATAVRADTTTITIRSYATTLSFDPDRISVKAGTPVRIRYINESTFGHNLVIVKKDADIDVIGPVAHEAASNGFVPEQHKSKMIGYSPLAGPGKTVEFTFVAPPAGEYPFVCFV
ncbi:MAG: plastocyanin/azurin family copper-binding protein, partial [Longimicrobiales bacterium]